MLATTYTSSSESRHVRLCGSKGRRSSRTELLISAQVGYSPFRFCNLRPDRSEKWRTLVVGEGLDSEHCRRDAEDNLLPTFAERASSSVSVDFARRNLPGRSGRASYSSIIPHRRGLSNPPLHKIRPVRNEASLHSQSWCPRHLGKLSVSYPVCFNRSGPYKVR